MTSVLNVDTIADKAGTGAVDLTKQRVPKMDVTCNGSTGTPSITQSFNVSSVDDLGVGGYRYNFTNNMSAIQFPAVNADNERGCGEINPSTTGRVDTQIRNPTNLSAVDATSYVVASGDLA